MYHSIILLHPWSHRYDYIGSKLHLLLTLCKVLHFFCFVLFLFSLLLSTLKSSYYYDFFYGYNIDFIDAEEGRYFTPIDITYARDPLDKQKERELQILDI